MQTATGDTIGGYQFFLHDLRATRVRADSVTYPHRHLGYEVFFLFDGTLVLETDDGAEVTAHAGQMLLVPANLGHATYRRESSCLNVTLRFFTDPPINPPWPLQVTDDLAPLRELFALFEDVRAMRYGWEERTQHRMVVLLSLLATAFSPLPHAFEAPAQPTSLAKQVDDYLRQHLSKAITLRDVAEAVGVSARSLVRHFKAETGETVMHRLQDLRIEAALALLGAGAEHSIKQIAAMVGFTDSAYFTRCFQRAMGTSPQQHRTHLQDTLTSAKESEGERASQ
ncbi:MAG TPA: AraC family transcriptional regulator [Armatimonadota bacterium]|nr:AraC family transcriptional regulator [Armatimonadota bacterium]